jgi:hypothetical protein
MISHPGPLRYGVAADRSLLWPWHIRVHHQNRYIVWTIGIIAVVAGIILALPGMAGHAVGGRRHCF